MLDITTTRLENESYTAFLKRIVRMCADKQIAYTEMGDALLGSQNVYSDDNLRKAFYVLDKIVDNLDGDFQITSNDIIREIELQKDELYKERVRYRDKMREFNKKLTEEARFENLRDTMLDAIKNSEILECAKNTLYSPADTEAALLISDVHYGIKIDNQINYFDADVAKNRISQLVDKTIHYCQLHRVKTLNVALLGDLVSGMIHTSVRVEQEEDMITQIIEVSDILANAINRLNDNIPEVKVFTVFGNHSRTQANKSDSVNRENTERLVYHYIKTKLPDIKVVTSMNDDYLACKIAGKNVILEHGDKGGNNPIINYINILGYRPDFIYRGHYHSFNIKNDNDCIIVTNGSIVGVDGYALSIRKSTIPSQTLIVYDTDVCTYEIKLN